jgi:hypothetical protein
MDVQLKQWDRLGYLDPSKILVGMREAFEHVPPEEAATLPYEFRSLRRRDVRFFQQGRQAALFCAGLSAFLKTQVMFAMVEDDDYDCVARFMMGDVLTFAPVQLKELPPPRVNPRADLQKQLNKIGRKYADAEDDLIVAIHLNDSRRFEFDKLTYPTSIASLWFYGAADLSQDRWVLIGDMRREDWDVTQFAYPGR